jgi:hypothetical protein
MLDPFSDTWLARAGAGPRCPVQRSGGGIMAKSNGLTPFTRLGPAETLPLATNRASCNHRVRGIADRL